MKALDISTIVSKVRINLDEIALNDSSFDSSTDESELDTIIKSKIEEALTFVYANAQATLLSANAATLLSGTATDTDVNNGYVSVTISSEKFLRLYYAVLESWPHAVFNPIFWPSREYSRLKNPLTTGTYQRPEVGIRQNAFASIDGEVNYTVLELYGPKKSEEKYKISYIEVPVVSPTATSVSIPDNLELAFIYYLTGLVMVILSDDRANAMFSQASALMGINENTQQND